jgi:cyanophycinase-like exopeptidase
MSTQKDLLREMKRLLATGKAEDRRAAQDILAQMGRNTKKTKADAAKAQTRLF